MEETYKQAATGGVLLSSMGSPATQPVYWDKLLVNASQVTNPPIDALREAVVTSTILYLGNHGNLLEDCRNTCRLIRLDAPLLDERFLMERHARGASMPMEANGTLAFSAMGRTISWTSSQWQLSLAARTAGATAASARPSAPPTSGHA